MGCCGSGPKWKRELVSDHKFENVDLDAFHDSSCSTRIGYTFIFIASFISFAVYIADLWTAVSLLVIGQTTITPAIPTEISKWIFFACIIISFLLLIWDMIKARKILATRDISLAFTSVIAYRYMSMKDYRYYCLFKSINSDSKGITNYAFFIYFTLKGWKRLLIAEAPRQIINIVTLEALVPAWIKISHGSISFDNDALGDSLQQKILTGTMAFSVLMFAISFFLVCSAVVLYVPLFCHIRGNLKEYCCHKADKRISDILRKQNLKTLSNKGRRPQQEREQSSFTQQYKRPLGPSGYDITPELVPLDSEYDYEKSPYFNNNVYASSPRMNPNNLQNNAQRHYDGQQQSAAGQKIETSQFEDIDTRYYPRPIAHQFPSQGRQYDYYSQSDTTSPVNSPTSSNRYPLIGSPAPSSAYSQQYQYRNYPAQE